MLNGSRVVLRAPLSTDIDFLIALRSDLRLQMQLLALPHANTSRSVQEWIDRRISDRYTAFFMIADAATDGPVGFIELREMDLLNGIGQLGICVAPEGQRNGYGSEALEILERYVSDVFRIRKVVLRVLVSNVGAIRMYVTAGYRVVGVHEGHVYQEGRYHDVQIMEKLLEDAGRERP